MLNADEASKKDAEESMLGVVYENVATSQVDKMRSSAIEAVNAVDNFQDIYKIASDKDENVAKAYAREKEADNYPFKAINENDYETEIVVAVVALIAQDD